MSFAEPLIEAARLLESSVGSPFVYSPGREYRTMKRHAWRCSTELDARGKPPPRPVDAIRAALAEMQPGDELSVRTNTQPAELIRVLRRNGISAEAVQLGDGSWRMLIERAPTA